MRTNSEIRQESLAFMKGNWGSGIVVTLAYLLPIFAGSFVTTSVGELIGEPIGGSVGEILGILVTIFVAYPLTFSLIKIFLGYVRGEQQLRVEGIFSSFKSSGYGKSIGLYLLISIYTFLWTLLLIVPGIIKSLSYALAPYILAENPELTANQAIDESQKMMQGHKMDLFLMILGYTGFAFLSILALGIPLLWLYPYYQVVFARFYEEVKAN
jgi:uncharacterized membrane protein